MRRFSKKHYKLTATALGKALPKCENCETYYTASQAWGDCVRKITEMLEEDSDKFKFSEFKQYRLYG